MSGVGEDVESENEMTKRRVSRAPSRKRIVADGITVAYYADRKADLTAAGAEWWDSGMIRNRDLRDALQEACDVLRHGMDLTFKGRSIGKFYPNPNRPTEPFWPSS